MWCHLPPDTKLPLRSLLGPGPRPLLPGAWSAPPDPQAQGPLCSPFSEFAWCLSILVFHILFRIRLSSSSKAPTGRLGGAVLNLRIWKKTRHLSKAKLPRPRERNLPPQQKLPLHTLPQFKHFLRKSLLCSSLDLI